MAKRNSLKSKLKASDRRRRRRPTPVPQAQLAHPSPPPVDVTGLVVDAIVGDEKKTSQLQDAVVVAALRGCVNGNRPSGDEASILFSSLQQIAERTDVEMRDFRTAIKQLLDQSTQHRSLGPQQEAPNPFVNYLAMLVS